MFLFMKNCNGPQKGDDIIVTTPKKVVIVKLVTKIDTAYVKKYIHDTVTVTRATVIHVDTVFVDGTRQVVMMPRIRRVYQDTIIPVDSVKIKYTANVTGTLDKIAIDYEDSRAERTILRTNTIDRTETVTKNPKGLYIGLGSNLGLNELSPSIMFVNNKNIFGVKYNIAGTQTPLQNVGITYSRKLF